MSKEEVDNNKEELTEFLNREETQKTAIGSAKYIDKAFGEKWFTIFDCVQVFRSHTIEQIRDTLVVLGLYGLVIVNNKKKIERYRLAKNKLKELLNAEQSTTGSTE